MKLNRFTMILVAVVMGMLIAQGTLAADEDPTGSPAGAASEEETALAELLADIEADRWAVVDDLVNSLSNDESTAEQLRATLNGLNTLELAGIVQNAASIDDINTILTGKPPEELAGEKLELGELDKDFAYTPVKPCRIIDTRDAGGPFSSYETREYYVYGSVASQGGAASCYSPKGEPRAVHINVTVVPVSGQGHFKAYPANIGPPGASLINYKTGVQNIANAATVQNYYYAGQPEIEFQNKFGTADLVVDVLGYYHNTRYLPGADFSSGDSSEVIYSSPKTVKFVNLSAPWSGTVIVNASGHFQFSEPLTDSVRCSISLGSSSAVDYSHLIVAQDTPTGRMTYLPFAATRGFNVPSAGTYTFRLNCEKFIGTIRVNDASITAIWVPGYF